MFEFNKREHLGDWFHISLRDGLNLPFIFQVHTINFRFLKSDQKTQKSSIQSMKDQPKTFFNVILRLFQTNE